MISNAMTGVDAMPTQRADRFRLPVGTAVRSVASPAEVYIKGGTVFADAAAWVLAPTSVCTPALDIPGARSWRPPV
jgi:hypothetical protein